MSGDRGRLPDFIIIGAMKCATSTLHEQLARLPGVFMSTPKEPNFFSNDEQWARGLDWYRGLFARTEPGDLCGESSTHYTKSPTYPLTIQRMRSHLPRGIKLIYVVRHPIERLVSQYIHEWTQQVVHGSIDAALETNPELIAYGKYAMQLQPFIDHWGRDHILPLFFEHFTRYEQATLERVCEFVSYPGRPQWDRGLREQNVSSERMRQSPWRDAIARFPGMTTLRRSLLPRALRDSIKSAWMMKERPQLSQVNLARLRDIYDEDLATLGAWFGLDNLRCDNFTQIAMAGHPAWHERARQPAA